MFCPVKEIYFNYTASGAGLKECICYSSLPFYHPNWTRHPFGQQLGQLSTRSHLCYLFFLWMVVLPSAQGCTLKSVRVQRLQMQFMHQGMLSGAHNRRALKPVWVSLRQSLEDPAIHYKHHRRSAAAWAEGLTTSYVTPPREALEVESFRWLFARCCLWGLGGSGTCSLTLSPKRPNLLPSQTFCKSCTFNRACKKTKGLLLK